jgi:predicted alpha/beta superfamily hydrolase
MPRPVTLARSEVHELTSRHAEADYQLWVAVPTRNPRTPPRDAYPVLYVTDADIWFNTAAEMTRLMHVLYGVLPPILVVGIAYGIEDPMLQGEIRNRDLTPTSPAAFAEAGKQFAPPGWKPALPEGRRMGRAAEFLAFLDDEVKPFVAERYPVEGKGTLFGCSLGGLFTLYALLSKPGSFDHYIAGSPAIWWDDAMLFGLEEQMAASTKDVAANLFMGVGSLEEGGGVAAQDPFKFITNVREMAARLESRHYPSLKVATQVFDNEGHTSVPPQVLTRGLRMAFRPSAPPTMPGEAPARKK